MKPISNLFFILFLVLGLAAPALANDKLIGNWKGDKVQLNLKADHSYTYKIKVFNFTGNWSASSSVLTLNYSIAGIKRKKTAGYYFKGDDLVMKQDDKGEVILKKQ